LNWGNLKRSKEMKRLLTFIAASLIFLLAGNARATFDSGSVCINPSDPNCLGAFDPATNTQIQLPPDGILNYTTVNIRSGVTVTFAKNAANTPVYILASGDVTIAGTVVVNGENIQTNSPVPGGGAPGGYRGGYGGSTLTPGGDGLGPGGGHGGSLSCSWGGGGGFGTAGRQYCSGTSGPAYGNVSVMPLIGGSGGGGTAGSGSSPGKGGGGGGGAILIASSTSISLTGSIQTEGGDTNTTSGGGSGGAVKLMANTISGNGTISAKGGHTYNEITDGAAGRVRLEAYTNSFGGVSDPPYTLNIWSPTNPPGSAFPANEPILRITSIAGVSAPTYPTGSYAQPDIWLPSNTTNPVTVNLSASYIPVGTTVTVSVLPQYGSVSNVNTTLSGVFESSTASANVNLSIQYSNVIMAQATYTMQEAMYWDDEKIEKVRVAATMGKESETVYITESGKEIKAKELKIAGLVK